jgi:hypothetical protein
MVLSEVDICNLALSQLGGKFTITSLDDDTVGARLCKANYAPLRDAVLEEMDWSFAIVRSDLTPDPDPALIDGYTKFKLPPEVLRVLSVYAGGLKLDDWALEQRFILAKHQAVSIKALESIKDTAMFSQAFTQALAARLAAELAMPLTNSTSMSQTMWQLYGQKVDLARTNDGLQGPAIGYPTGRVINARRGFYR